ncbi:hypothetical protein AMTRI_Chr05g71780 [Amborella trichopoda]
MHTCPLMVLHSDSSWMLIDLWLFFSLLFSSFAKYIVKAPDILMRTVMISVLTYCLLLSPLNGSHLGWATIMVLLPLRDSTVHEVLFSILAGKQQNLPLPCGKAE